MNEKQLFRWIVLALGFLAVMIFGYNQYLQTKKHNLDVVTQIRLCSGLSGDSVEDCSKAIKQQAVFPKYLYKLE